MENNKELNVSNNYGTEQIDSLDGLEAVNTCRPYSTSVEE